MEDYRKKREAVDRLQSVAVKILGEPLRMRVDDVLDLAERVREYGVPLACFLAFVRCTYSATKADIMVYKNFLNSPKTFVEFEKHLDHLRDATPMRMQRDLSRWETAGREARNLVDELVRPGTGYSPLFRYTLLSMMDNPAKEDFREAAEDQLLENPYYWKYMPEHAGHFPCGKEMICES